MHELKGGIMKTKVNIYTEHIGTADGNISSVAVVLVGEDYC